MKKQPNPAIVQEKERILEVLLSQERVLTLLYDKTFPPKKDSKAAQLALLSSQRIPISQILEGGLS